ncbi:MAG: S9 family peptidase [Ignavibacteriaceae bacterium]|jgi:dipeptidyl-peptidase-4
MIKSSIKYLLYFVLFLSFELLPQPKELTVELIQTNKDFFGKNLSGVQWFSGGEKFSFLKRDPAAKATAIYEHDCKTGEEKILVPGNDLKLKPEDQPFSIQNYEWLPNEKYILFTGTLPARSLKTGGAFYIYEIAQKKFFELASSEKKQENARFSPDGEKLAFVRDNNVFVVDIQSQKETQITFDGSETLLNGNFDWVYEEEFSIINGIEWSPDSKRIAFWQLDQSQVPEMHIAKWDSLYLNFLDMRYPKAGTRGSFVKIGIADIATAKTVWVDLGEETDIYIPRLKFTTDANLLAVQRLNRLQNKLDILFADVVTGKTKTVFAQSDSCWIDINDNLQFLKDKKHFIWTSAKDGFEHIYLFDYNGNQIKQLTSGNFEVDKILGVDETNKEIYFTSNERSTVNSDLYSVNYESSKRNRITETKGSHTIDLSPNQKYFIDRYSNANLLGSVYLYKTNGDKIRDLVVSDMSVFKDYNLSPVEFFRFKTTDGVELDASIIKPANFDPSKKYPVLVNNYSGPGSKIVTDAWGRDLWFQMLSQKGYIIFAVDNRGTSGRGESFKKIVYKNLGYWEVNDQIEGAKYLASLPYVDASRIGIWGWSYGGYASALTLAKAPDYFKAAIAVAPVTDWRFYDNIYTERYMSTPQLNPKGYETSSVMTYADQLKGKLLLIHGTADDNVHFENSVALVTKLVAENKPFQTMYYPEKNHGIGGGKTRLHLYQLMTEFLLNNL